MERRKTMQQGRWVDWRKSMLTTRRKPGRSNNPISL